MQSGQRNWIDALNRQKHFVNGKCTIQEIRKTKNLPFIALTKYFMCLVIFVKNWRFKSVAIENNLKKCLLNTHLLQGWLNNIDTQVYYLDCWVENMWLFTSGCCDLLACYLYLWKCIQILNDTNLAKHINRHKL